MSTMTKTLADLNPGESGIVVAFGGGGEFQRRIVSLGIYIGCEIEVRGGGAAGGMLVAVGDSRIALGCGMARKVMIA